MQLHDIRTMSSPLTPPSDVPIRLAEMTHRAQTDIVVETFRSTNSFGRAAVQAAMLINGGGAVALLGLVGHLFTATNPNFPLIRGLAVPLGIFALGALLAAVTTGFSYLTALIVAGTAQ